MNRTKFQAVFAVALVLSGVVKGAAWFENGLINQAYLELLNSHTEQYISSMARTFSSNCAVQRDRLRATVLARDFDAADEWVAHSPCHIGEVELGWLFNQASSDLAAGDVPASVRLLDLIMASGKLNSKHLYSAALMYEKAGSRQKAIDAFRAGIQLDSPSALAKGWSDLPDDLYRKKEWVQVTELVMPIWTALPPLQPITYEWRSIAVQLAESFQQLQRMRDAESVYRKLAQLDPVARDWQMDIAQMNLGDIALSRGDLRAAIEHYTLAYNIAVQLPEATLKYEENAWRLVDRLADTITRSSERDEWVGIVRSQLDSDARNLGLVVLYALVNEKQCDLPSARELFTSASTLAPRSAIITNHVTRLACP